MNDSGLLEIGNVLHMECLWFCFSFLLQKDLDEVVENWNTHRIRRSGYGTMPGVPDVLYYLPNRSDRQDCKIELSQEKIADVEEYSLNMSFVEDDANEYQEYFNYVMENENLFLPTNVDEAFQLFQKLINFATGV